MTHCANCGTTQGPFVRDAMFPGKPVCGYPKRRQVEGDRVAYVERDHHTGHDHRVTNRQARIRECLKRRDLLDAERYMVTA